MSVYRIQDTAIDLSRIIYIQYMTTFIEIRFDNTSSPVKLQYEGRDGTCLKDYNELIMSWRHFKNRTDGTH